MMVLPLAKALLSKSNHRPACYGQEAATAKATPVYDYEPHLFCLGPRAYRSEP